ncbi:hypothetical protein GUI12_01525 [Anaplasmataceae bacterium AB001_6]|nr:hypothetical protein GUI12_01525 [Anaplasmataceae bacterium AB001_6]
MRHFLIVGTFLLSTFIIYDAHAECVCAVNNSSQQNMNAGNQATQTEKVNVYNQYDVIALGKVAKKFYLNEEDEMIKFLVAVSWKMKKKEKYIYLLTKSNPDKCGFFFKTGHDYVIFGKRMQELFLISSCSPTTDLYDMTEEQLKNLGGCRIINPDYMHDDLIKMLGGNLKKISNPQTKKNKKMLIKPPT